MDEPRRTDVNAGGCAAEVAARTLSTFDAKKSLNVCASITALSAERPRPSSLSTESQSVALSDVGHRWTFVRLVSSSFSHGDHSFVATDSFAIVLGKMGEENADV